MDNYECCSDRTKRRKIRAKVMAHLESIRAENTEVSGSFSALAVPVLGESSDLLHLEGLSELQSDFHEDVPTAEIHLDSVSEADIFPSVVDPDDEIYYVPTDSNSEYEMSDDEEDQVFNIRRQLAKWAVKFNISHSALSDLLTLLIKSKLDVPKDPRTLLSTPVNICADIHNRAGGLYYHFGIARALCSQLVNLSPDSYNDIETLTLRINIDGLPLFKSSLQTIWPILGMVKEFPKCGVFMIGVFGGRSKPSSASEYLEPFIHDLQSVCRDGVIYNNKHYNVALPDAFMCDAPARSFLKCVKNHNGYFGCERCVQKGVSILHRMTFPELSAAPRTNVQFEEMVEAQHHTDQSPLIGLGIGCVTDFVLDYMHLVCLGVVRRLIFLWTSGPLKGRVSAGILKVVSENLVAVRKCLPREFARKPRSLQEFKMWKATEFRQFLLYTGPVVLHNKIPTKLYQNFMVLSYSMRLLLSPTTSSEYIDYAEDLIKVFIQNFAKLYGRDMVVYNVHNLIHMADDFRKYGSLDNISCFPFENFLGKLKRRVRKGQNPLSQIIKRVCEMQKQDPAGNPEKTVPLYKKPHFAGPLPVDCSSGIQYKQYLDPRFLISCGKGDNCFEIDGKVAIVRNILCSSSNETLIVYEDYQKYESAFHYPGDSKLLGIKLVSKLSGQLHVTSPQNVTCKFVLLSLQEKTVVFPQLHTM